MGYSSNPADVRVDFFKESGKWYDTEAVRWTGGYFGKDQPIHAAFAKSLRDHFKDRPDRFSEFDAVCLHPYHEHGHPIQLKRGIWRTYGR